MKKFFLKKSFMLKALLVINILTIFSSKIYHVTNWTTNNYNTHIAQYIKK